MSTISLIDSDLESMSREEMLSRDILSQIAARKDADNSEGEEIEGVEEVDEITDVDMKIHKVTLGSKGNLIKPLHKCSISFEPSLTISESPIVILKPSDSNKGPSKRLRRISIKIDSSNGKSAGKAILIFVSDSKTKSKDIMKNVAHRKFNVPYTKEDFEKEKSVASNKDRRTTCGYCNVEFISRTRLFQHIRVSGHEVDSPGNEINKPNAVIIFDEEGKGTVNITKAESEKMPTMKLVILLPVPSDIIINSIKCSADIGDEENVIYTQRRMLPSEKSLQVKEMGLSFLSSITSTIDPIAQANCLLGVIKLANKLLSQQQTLSMYSDWSPPKLPPIQEIALLPSDAYAFGTAGVSNNPDKALMVEGFWKSTECKSTSGILWGVKLAEPVCLVAFQLIFDESCWPDEISVQVAHTHSSVSIAKKSLSNSTATYRPVMSIDESTIQEERIIYLNSVSTKPVQFVQFLFKGKARSNSAGFIALRHVKLFTNSAEKLFTQPGNTLTKLESWVEQVVVVSNQPALYSEALLALRNLSLSSGALTALLRLVNVLLFDLKLNEDKTVQSLIQSTDKSTDKNPFIQELCTAMEKEREIVIENEDKASRAWPSNISCKAAFDPASCTPGMNITQDGMRVNYILPEPSGSTHAHAILNVGFTHGQATWWMKLEEDTNSQTSCFGIAIKPVTDSSYDHSKQLWMYRAYNGNLYARGKLLNNKKFKKINKGDIVRADLDMFAGTLSFSINDEYQGIAFTDLCGLHIFPAVTFYGEKRSVSLVDCKSTAVVCHHLCNMKETVFKVGHGQLGKSTWLGYDGNDNIKTISVSEKPVQYGLSLHPPLGGQAYVEYELGGVYECLNVSVALNDDVKPEDKVGVLFEVYGDGKKLWNSSVITSKGKVESAEIKLLDTRTLQLRVTDVTERGSKKEEEESQTHHTKGAHAVFSVASIEYQTMYRRWYRSVFTSDILIPKITSNNEGNENDKNKNMCLAANILENLSLLSLTLLLPMRNTNAPPSSKYQISKYDLESPFAVQVCNETFSLCCMMLSRILLIPPVNQQSNDSKLRVLSPISITIIESILQILKVNIRRLVISHIDPKEVGLRVDGEVLNNISNTLNLFLSKDNLQISPALQQQAIEVLDEALPLIEPKAINRINLFLEKVGRVRVVEFQIRWPALTHHAVEFPNLERALLLIQLECRKKGWKAQVFGKWMGFAYLVTELPENYKIEDFLDVTVGKCFKLAGYNEWNFPAGMRSPQILIKLERHVHWNRQFRLTHEQGISVVRLYTNEYDVQEESQIFKIVCDNIKTYSNNK